LGSISKSRKRIVILKPLETENSVFLQQWCFAIDKITVLPEKLRNGINENGQNRKKDGGTPGVAGGGGEHLRVEE